MFVPTLSTPLRIFNVLGMSSCKSSLTSVNTKSKLSTDDKPTYEDLSQYHSLAEALHSTLPSDAPILAEALHSTLPSNAPILPMLCNMCVYPCIILVMCTCMLSNVFGQLLVIVCFLRITRSLLVC